MHPKVTHISHTPIPNVGIAFSTWNMVVIGSIYDKQHFSMSMKVL